MSRFYASGSGLPGPGSSVVTLETARDGFWTDVPDPKFVSYNGYTYFGWVNGTTGNICVAAVNNTTLTVSASVNLHSALGGANGNPDDHDSPSLLVRSSDHKLVAAYCPHDSTPMYVRISTTSLDTDPTLANGFAAEINASAQFGVGGDRYTYPSLIELTSEGAIYLWFRRHITTGASRQTYSKSTDGGSTWAAEVNVWASVGNVLCYRRLATNGTDRMDLYMTDNARTIASPSTLYHAYWNAASWHKSDGTSIATPVTTSTATVVKGTSDGPACPLSCWYDGSNNPVTNIMTYGVTDDATIWQARYSAGWSVNQVATTGGKLNGTNPFALAAAVDHADVNTVWLPKKVGSKLEIFRYESADSGVTWTGTQVTSGSSVDNTSPDPVWNHGSTLKVIWAFGTYTNDQNFSFGTKGGY